MSRPWTTGPWRFEWWQHPEKPWWNPKGRLLSGDKIIAEEGYYCEDDVFNWSEADAALIALAPRMAEAILSWDDCDKCPPVSIVGTPLPRDDCDYCAAALFDVIDELRKIIKEHDDE